MISWLFFVNNHSNTGQIQLSAGMLTSLGFFPGSAFLTPEKGVGFLPFNDILTFCCYNNITTLKRAMSQKIYFPDIQRFKDEMERSKLIPVCTEIVADLDTPLILFAKVVKEHKHIFLFESMEGGEKWGRYSFIGYNPLVTFSSKADSITIKEVKRVSRTGGTLKKIQYRH